MPTFRELGYPGIEVFGWTGAFASSRASPRTVEAWSSAIKGALASAEVRDKLRDAGVESTGSTPQELAKIIDRDTAYWTPIVSRSALSQ